MKKGSLCGVVLRAYFNASKKTDKEILMNKAKEYTINRKETQEGPAYNLGSYFANYRLRNNIRNLIIRCFVRLLCLLQIPRETRQILRKKAFCLLYGVRELIPYISNKNINTFIFRDSKADELFPYYLDFMERIADNTQLEIQIKPSI